MKHKGSTIMATSVVISGLFAIITGMIAYTFKDKVDMIASVQASVSKIESEALPDLKTRTALNEKDITYIKSGIDDIRKALNIKK